MSSVELIIAPFHAGAYRHRVGNGPHGLLNAGLAEALHAENAAVNIVEIAPVDAFEGEIGRSFEVKRRVASAVAVAIRAERFPLVLAGNCNASVGTYAGLGDPDAGVVWFDAHPDLNTPDELMSGYFDSMGVATLAGQCWRGLASTIPGFQPMNLSQLIYCGIRDCEPGQRKKVEAHGIRAIYGSTDRPVDFAGELDTALTGSTGHMLIHLDLDCLDTSVGRANEYAVPGGLQTEDLAACLSCVTARAVPIGMTIASFNPDMEGSDAIAAAGVHAAQDVIRALVARTAVRR